MNIGNRKKKPEDETIPTFEKKCGLEKLNCNNCLLYDSDAQWCRMYKEELHEHLQSGKRFK